MDEGGGYGLGDDPGQKLNVNEAISAVADEGFVVEEEDDDYEDLYSDVNVGEGFLQSLKSKDEVVDGNVEEVERKIDVPQQFSAPQQTLVSERGPALSGAVGEPVVAARDAEVFGTEGIRGQDMSGMTAGGLRVELGQGDRKVSGLEEQNVGQVGGFVQPVMQQPPGSVAGAEGSFQHQQPYSRVGDMRNLGNDGFGRGGNMNINGVGGNGVHDVVGGSSIGGHVGAGGVGGNTGGGGGTMLFVGDLHWWTTDAELEAELCKYGVVKEVKFFDEKASGKSKGYCQVEFYDPGAAAACKEGMNGHVFNGRPCVVAFASPFSIKRMGEAQVSRTQQTGQAVLNQPKRAPNDQGNNIAAGGNYQGGGDTSRGGYGRGNWGRGNSQGMGNRGGAGGMRRGGRGIMGNGGNAFNQGMGGNPQMMHPQGMMPHGFDPGFGGFGGPMGGMGGYGGYPGGPMAPFPGMMQPFPPVGMPGVAPHVNPAFFGRGMPMNGMGMVPTSGMDRPNMGTWQDPNMAGWDADDQSGRVRESSYGDEVASEPRYDEASQDRDGWQGNTKAKDRGSEKERSVSSDKKFREEKETGLDRDVPIDRDTVYDRNYADNSRQRDEMDINRSRERESSRDRDRDRMRGREKERGRGRERERERERDRDRYRDDRAKYADHHRHRDHESQRDVDWDGGSSSRSQKKSQYDDDRRPRSRDSDYGKKRRLTAE